MKYGPTAMRFRDGSDTRPVSTYGSGSLWLYDVDTERGPELLRFSSRTGRLEQTVAMPQLAQSAGAAAVVLLAIGGLAYTVGALVYAFRRPDPVPAVFGYHEVFHALTLVALACQYVAIAFFVIRVG